MTPTPELLVVTRLKREQAKAVDDNCLCGLPGCSACKAITYAKLRFRDSIRRALEAGEGAVEMWRYANGRISECAPGRRGYDLDIVGDPCRKGLHEWCANRNSDECHCSCACHIETAEPVYVIPRTGATLHGGKGEGMVEALEGVLAEVVKLEGTIVSLGLWDAVREVRRLRAAIDAAGEEK